MKMKVFNASPTPASRPRVTRCGAYIAEPYKTFKENFKLWAQLNFKPIEGALSVNIYFHMKIPASLSNKKKKELEGEWHIKKPDTDNLVKAVLDGLNGYAYKDDSQVCQLFTTKRYSDNPRIEIIIKTIV